MPTDKLFLLFGCVLTGSGVALGAFGAHGLRKSQWGLRCDTTHINL